MKKNDWILIILVAAVAGIFLAVLLLRPERGSASGRDQCGWGIVWKI